MSYSLRLLTAIAAAKAARTLSRICRHGGSTFPGIVAEHIAPGISRQLAQQLTRGRFLVSGTNGKTTTTRVLSAILRHAGWRVVHNRQGANLPSGIAATLVLATDPLGSLNAYAGLFEVDEAYVPAITTIIQPTVALLHNLSRDQLDRYGELDHLLRLWRETFVDHPTSATVVANADDPLVVRALEHIETPIVWYGFSLPESQNSTPIDFTDARYCSCGAVLSYRSILYGHFGQWYCRQCGRERPPLDVSGSQPILRGAAGSRFSAKIADAHFDITIQLPGFYNAANVLGALAAAVAGGVPPNTAVAPLAQISPAYGRGELVESESHRLRLWLVKNPMGFLQALTTALYDQSPRGVLLMAINDRIADGQDVSWLWDVDFEKALTADSFSAIVCSGTRACDIAVRLKYAGMPVDRLIIREQLLTGVETAFALAQGDSILPVFATYTAMRALRELFVRLRWVGPEWEV
ncbi:MAG: MurT ligase domain-containing protein [Chloroflexi bacterium]|nr:MurT ligase domain-containing protein [Chloroflexota bacterium]